MKKAALKRTIVMGFGACIAFVGLLSVGKTDVQAATNNKTASTAIAWVKSKLGKGIDYDKLYGNQCVDLIKAYYVYLGQSQPFGNGADYAYNRLPSGWKRYKGAQPKKGDVLVYTGGYGGYGHVAIYETDYSTYHQNWNSHSYVERVTYKYNGNFGIKYWGVIRPDFKAEAVSGTAASKTSVAKYTGVKYYKGVWTYLKNDVPDYSFTGVAQSTTGNWVFVKNGRFNTSFTGVAKSTTGNWIFVKNGRFSTSFTGAAKSTAGNWVFVKKGRYTTNFTGIANVVNSNKKYYMVKGRWNNKYTGKYGNYNIKNGVVV